MTITQTTADENAPQAAAPALPPGIDKTHVGAAISKLISAAVGDLVVVMSRSPGTKFHTLADIEWLVLPAVLTGQYYVAELTHTEHGVRAPVAVVTWASVSGEVAARLAGFTGQGMRLKPDEWTSGPHLWLIDLVGEPRALMGALKAVAEGPLKGRDVSLMMRGANGEHGVQKLHELIARTGSGEPLA